MTSTEEHYSVKQLAAIWGVSPRTIRRILEKYAHLIPNFQTTPTRRRSRFAPHLEKRRYHTVRIPRSLMERIYRDLLPTTSTVSQDEFLRTTSYKRCAKCKAPIISTDKFCKRCGVKIEFSN